MENLESKQYSNQILETENSDTDEMNFDDSLNQSPQKSGPRGMRLKNEPQSQRGDTMFVNGKAIQMNKEEQALNKREKSNWLVHLLFIR